MLTPNQLVTKVRACTDCRLHELRTGVAVPGELGAKAPPNPIAFIAEAPGQNEGETGRPLVGRAGRLFERLLGEAGLKRDEVLLMNRVRCRPPNNNLKAHPEAVHACDRWTKEELRTYNPKVVVVMGKTAIGELFGKSATVGRTRGKVRMTGEEHPYGKRVWVPTYHPAALLPGRTPEARGLVVEDLKLAVELYALD